MFPLAEKASRLAMLVFDVDGVMTDGSVTYSHQGDELKTFNIKDGLGIKLAQKAGLEVAIITGRRSTMLERRARELGINTVIQGREDKLDALKALIQSRDLPLHRVAYMGDDLPDLGAIMSVGIGACPADAAAVVARASDWVATAKGGQGAVREFIEALLIARRQWQSLVDTYVP